MNNVARDLIIPTSDNVALRMVFLYVGQGLSGLVLAADNGRYRTALVDINLDCKNGGIDVPRLVKDLVGNAGLDLFINTHPHMDHLGGVLDLAELVEIKEIWHSGHVPGKKHADAFKALEELIEQVQADGGRIVELRGSRQPEQLGEVECFILAPADYVKEDIEGETPDERYARIHEQCWVLRIGFSDKWIMIPGDADRDAWEKHITEYHAERIKSDILVAPHHGSRSFFKCNEEESPYLEALKVIAPSYVIISAPTPQESPYSHPDADALELYGEYLPNGDDDILHTGAKRHSFICDIFYDGEIHVSSDNGDLVATYGLDGGNGSEGEGKGTKSKTAAGIVGTKVDRRPMGLA
jgi:competence protein ComEC